MTDTVQQSFCERCGTRYTVTQHEAKPEGGLSKLGRTFKRRAEPDGSAEPTVSTTLPNSEGFDDTFHFCLQCRQYTCQNCWNAEEGYCQSCRPLGGLADPAAVAGGATLMDASPQAPEPVAGSWPSGHLDLKTEDASLPTHEHTHTPSPAPLPGNGNTKPSVNPWGLGQGAAADAVGDTAVGRAGKAETASTEPIPVQADREPVVAPSTDDSDLPWAKDAASSGMGAVDPWRGVVFSSDDADSDTADASPLADAPKADSTAPARVTPPAAIATPQKPPGPAQKEPEAWPKTDAAPSAPTSAQADAESAWPEADQPAVPPVDVQKLAKSSASILGTAGLVGGPPQADDPVRSIPQEATEPEVEAQAQAEPEVEPEVEAQAQAEPEVEAQAQAEPEVEPEVEAQAQAEPEVEPEVEAQAQAEPEVEAQAQAEPEVEPEVEAQAQAEPEVEPEVEAQAQAEPEVEPEVEAQAQAEPEVEAQAQAEPEVEPEAPLPENVDDVAADQAPVIDPTGAHVGVLTAALMSSSASVPAADRHEKGDSWAGLLDADARAAAAEASMPESVGELEPSLPPLPPPDTAPVTPALPQAAVPSEASPAAPPETALPLPAPAVPPGDGQQPAPVQPGVPSQQPPLEPTPPLAVQLSTAAAPDQSTQPFAATFDPAPFAPPAPVTPPPVAPPSATFSQPTESPAPPPQQQGPNAPPPGAMAALAPTAPPTLMASPAAGGPQPPPGATQKRRAVPLATSRGCSNCGLPLSAKARFCRRCGTAQA